MDVVVTGVGVVCPLGLEAAEVCAKVRAGGTGLREHGPLAALPGGSLAGVVEGPDLRRWLLRRKDAKLLPRAAELGLVAAGVALGAWPGDRADLGLFVGVGREPPDDGESEPALIAAAVDGKLDEGRLAGPGRDLYPPLLPLKTLPNMSLAHISINLGVMGPNNAWAGALEAGLRAVAAGAYAVAEGRCPAALVGGAASLVDLGSARDRLRMGAAGAPGEAAAFLLIETRASAEARGALILGELSVLAPGEGAGLQAAPGAAAWVAAAGDAGPATGALMVVGALFSALPRAEGSLVRLAGDPGASALRVSAAAAC